MKVVIDGLVLGLGVTVDKVDKLYCCTFDLLGVDTSNYSTMYAKA